MSSTSLWITGTSRSGKTTRLIEQFDQWAVPTGRSRLPPLPLLVFAANGDNRLDLVDRLSERQGEYPVDSHTPIGFFQNEVLLFFPLLAQALKLKTAFPLRLRPETEQELATRLWQPDLESGALRMSGVRDYFAVRRTLDIMQLAAFSGTAIEDIPAVLQDGFAGQTESPEIWSVMGTALQRWRQWCLERGLLTYGIITELYWRYLLPHPVYQANLKTRYRALLVDDVDEYPAIAQALFTFLLDQNVPAVFTYNPEGSVRWGLGADPDYLSTLADRCQIQTLPPIEPTPFQDSWRQSVLDWINEPLTIVELPDAIQTIQTTARSQLLRQTAEVILHAVQTGAVQPQEIAVIAPGFDPIARYTLREILSSRGIGVEVLNDQRPLISSPMVRSLLTLLGLVYPGLGRLLNREAIAEMLVVLSRAPGNSGQDSDPVRIDPVRAGLLTDHCFVPDLETPHLLPATEFSRWDRLGYQASAAYEEIRQWMDTQRSQQSQRLIPNPVALLDRAVQRFLAGGSNLPSDQLAILRELMETAQHYWDVATRLRQSDPDSGDSATSATVGQFIQLLRDGTITADPYPVRPIGNSSPAITLATAFQYRSERRTHRWHFWLDASSSFWLTGGGGLFGAPLFLQARLGRLWTVEDTVTADRQRLQHQVADLLSRVSDRLYLCHSDLAINGQEQAGPLLPLVNSATPLTLAALE